MKFERLGAARALPVVAWALLGAQLLLAAPAAGQPEPESAAQPRSPMTVDALSVVRVRSKALAGARSSRTLGAQRDGSGVVIGADGLVLTIGYLIVEAETVDVVTAAGHIFPATVVGYDYATGFGLVRALQPLPVKPVTIGDSSRIGDRELVLIVGYDGVAPAYVVSRRRFVGYWEYLLDEAIYTAPATVNWSGAALLSQEGRLLGIGSLVVGDAMGPGSQVPGNLFVPIDLLKPLLGDLIAAGKSSAPPRPWLGINTQEVQGNVIVIRVTPEGPADRAEIRAGDVIVGIDGKAVKGQADFYRRLWAQGAAGVEVPLEVLREGKLRNVPVQSISRDTYFRARPTL